MEWDRLWVGFERWVSLEARGNFGIGAAVYCKWGLQEQAATGDGSDRNRYSL